MQGPPPASSRTFGSLAIKRVQPALRVARVNTWARMRCSRVRTWPRMPSRQSRDDDRYRADACYDRRKCCHRLRIIHFSRADQTVGAEHNEEMSSNDAFI